MRKDERSQEATGLRRHETVAVIIPVFNGANFIRKSTESALGQTHRPVEVIVVDDGSSDAPGAQVSDLPVRIVQQMNRGVAAARNAGLAMSTAQWLVFLDADDWLAPTYIEKCLDLAIASGAGVVSADVHLVGSSGEVEGITADSARLPSTVRRQQLEVLRRNLVVSPSLYRRSVFAELGEWNESRRLSGVEDWEMAIRVVTSGLSVGVTPEPLAYRRLHEAQLSRARLTSIRGRIEVLQNFQDSMPDYRLRIAASSALRAAEATLNALRAGQTLLKMDEHRAGLRSTAWWWATRRQLPWRRRAGLLQVALAPRRLSQLALQRILRT